MNKQHVELLELIAHVHDELVLEQLMHQEF